MTKQTKVIIFLLIFSAFFSFGNISEATSGACSYHGGVNYSAGADYDGSVICNDGWRDSSVLYSDMSGNTSSQCPIVLSPSEYEKRKNEIQVSRDTLLSNYNRQKIQINQNYDQRQSEQTTVNRLDIGAQAQTLANLGALGTGSSGASYLKDVSDNNQFQIDQLNTRRDHFLLEAEKNYQQWDWKYLELLNCYQVESIPQCPQNSTLNSNGGCSCNSGFSVENNQCISDTEICQSQFGQNSSGYKNTDGKLWCKCSENFILNESRTSCVQKQQPVPVVTPTSCNDGFILNNNQCQTYDQFCQLKIGDNSYGYRGDCFCKGGFKLDTKSNSCIAIPPITAFAGKPKTYNQMYNCEVVANKLNKLYYLKGNKWIKKMFLKNKECFATEKDAIDKGFKGAK